MTYHYVDGDGNSEGPLAANDLRTLFADGLLNRESLISRDGGEWKEARHFPELYSKAASRTTYVHQQFVSAKKEEAKNPPGFVLFVILALLVWPLGLIGSIIFLCDPKSRGAGAALLGISVASALLMWVLFLGRVFAS